MKVKINEIWKAQEEDSLFTSGLLLRGFGGTFLPEIYVGLQSPGKFRCIVASLSNQVSVDIAHFNGLKDLEVDLVPDIKKIGRNYLIFKLINPQHNDIFSVLAEDLISSIAKVQEEDNLVRNLFNRFENWNRLFKKVPGDWLSAEEQIGLYGELYFLRSLLKNSKNGFMVISSWVGSEKQVRDFQEGTWAVEVKTTKGNNHQRVQINGDRQLDDTNFEHLFLYHLSLEILQKSGESLAEIVNTLYCMLESDLLALNRFKTKLLFSGYRDEDSHHYVGVGYLIRKDAFYKIVGNFPRIKENELRSGIGDVKYSVILSSCVDYIIEKKAVFNTINL